MGTTGRFGGGGHGLTGPKHVWYDTDYTELYKGLAVVIGFFLFLVLLLLIFILISYLRKWYRLKKGPDASAVAAVSAVSSVKSSSLAPSEESKYAKRYSKSGLPTSSQPQTPLVKSMPKHSISSMPVEMLDGKQMKSHHGQQQQQQQYHQNQQQQYHQNQHPHYQEFPPAHYPAQHHHPNAKPDYSQPSAARSSRPSLSTIALT